MLFDNLPPNRVLRNAFSLFTKPGTTLYLAAPFFTYPEPILEALRSEVSVKLIVRLGPATDANALERLRTHPNVIIRYFTNRSFHSKIYIFGSEVAIVGSANLTDGGLNGNSEANITLQPSDPDFDEVCALFQKYWLDAHAYDETAAQKYTMSWRHKPDAAQDPLVEAVKRDFGYFGPSGIKVGEKAAPKDRLFVEDYKKKYQTFLASFQHLQDRYNAAGFRRLPEDVIPLRIEIDQFLSWVRRHHASDEAINKSPIRIGEALTEFADQLIAEWKTAEHRYMMDTIPGNYRRISKTFGTKADFDNANEDEILDALETCHAFSEQLRFTLGGLQSLRREFLRNNGINNIKTTLSHLLFDEGDDVERIADCIYHSRYKLRNFGRSCAQELAGWVGQSQRPVWNGRTSKSLRYIGYNVEQIS